MGVNVAATLVPSLRCHELAASYSHLPIRDSVTKTYPFRLKIIPEASQLRVSLEAEAFPSQLQPFP